MVISSEHNRVFILCHVIVIENFSPESNCFYYIGKLQCDTFLVQYIIIYWFTSRYFNSLSSKRQHVILKYWQNSMLYGTFAIFIMLYKLHSV